MKKNVNYSPPSSSSLQAREAGQKNVNSTRAWVYGIHAVTSLLNQSPERVVRLCIQESRANQAANLIAHAESLNISVELLSTQALTALFPSANHQGFAASFLKPREFTESDLDTFLNNPEIQPFFLVLDGVQDPHNLGACLRSADAAGVHAVIVPKDRSVGMTPTVAKVACGAAENVPLITVTNLVRTLNFLKENHVWCIGLDGNASTSIYQFNLTGSLALVLGGEGEGLRRLTRETCDQLLSIPMQGSVASLNVSVATGVVLFEAVRQKKRASE